MILYAISDPSTLSFKTLSRDLKRIRDRGANMILYRDKETQEYEKRAYIFVKEAKRLGFDRILLHNSPKQAAKLGVWGIHCSSDSYRLISEARQLGLKSVASTHSLEEILEAQKENVDLVTLSPLFASPNKGKPLGEELFANIVRKSIVPVIALGGIINSAQMRKAIKCGAVGIASIRYFL